MTRTFHNSRYQNLKNNRQQPNHSRSNKNQARYDVIGLVGFHDQGFVITPPKPSHNAQLLQTCQTLHSRVGGWGTNIAAGLRHGINLLKPTPHNRLRRMWILSDGHPNHETDAILPLARLAKQNYININTIGFGDDYDELLLRQISSATHNGKFISVKTLRQLTDALVRGSNSNPSRNRHYRPETTVFAIDLSLSMSGRMGSKTKIQVVEEALLHLLNFKQHCFS